MKYNKSRKLGKYGDDVSPVGIGAMSFTNFYGPCNDSQAKHILNAALDMNLNHIDTSNADERIGGSLASVAHALKQNIHTYRIHDVKETNQMIKVLKALNK